MESLTQVNTGFALGQTGGLQPLSSIFTGETKYLYVPEFLWQFGNSSYVTPRDIFKPEDERYNLKCHIHQTLSIDLCDTSIDIGLDEGNVVDDLLAEDDLYTYACINVNRDDNPLTLEVKINDCDLDNIVTGADIKVVSYLVHMDGEMHTYFSRFVPLHPGAKPFNRIRGLGARNTLAAKNFICSLGLAKDKYTMLFRGKKLSRQSYIFLLGTYGLVLDDDFNYDSLVFLRSANSGVVDIDRIVHTVSTYMTKIIVLHQKD